MSFLEKFNCAVEDNQSLVCIGLDPDPRRLPEHLKGEPNPTHMFIREIISATKDLVCAYKPNFAFYGALGLAGWEALEGIMKIIPKHLPTILDFKAGDIGNSAARYAHMAYGQLGADGATVNPLMGKDAVEPFIEYSDRCAFLLCLTSNTSSSDFQRLPTKNGFFYEALVRKAVAWSATGPCGLVVGATHPQELHHIRHLAPNLPFLIPGIGAQGGEANATIQNGINLNGKGVLVNSSRNILYASNDLDFAEAAREATEELRKTLAQATIQALKEDNYYRDNKSNCLEPIEKTK